MARATALETAERVDHLQVMILEGEPNTSCLAFARNEWGVKWWENPRRRVPGVLVSVLQSWRIFKTKRVNIVTDS